MGSSATLPGMDSWLGHGPGLCWVWLGHRQGWDLQRRSVERRSQEVTCAQPGVPET